MNTSGAALTLIGVWLLTQVTKGHMLSRLGVL